MTTAASREAFEAWYHANFFTDQKMLAHAAWQASRKQALAEATQACSNTCTPNLNSYGDGYNQGAIDCEKSIKELK